MSLTGGNRNDVTQLLPLLAKVPSVAGLVGRPRRRPDVVLGDRGYDHDKYRRTLAGRPLIGPQPGARPVAAVHRSWHACQVFHGSPRPATTV